MHGGPAGMYSHGRDRASLLAGASCYCCTLSLSVSPLGTRTAGIQEWAHADQRGGWRVTGPVTSVTGAASGAAPGPGAGIARGAALIAGLTVISRVLGLIRTLVFSQIVGAGCLGTAYVTANQVP